MPVFGHLDTFPIRIWDESRLALNAYEMHKNGNFIVTYFEGYPDMWNTKPPFLIWLQVFFMKTIGVNELAVRLPSAFAALFTCITLLVFSLKFLKSFWYGFIVVFVLITSQGYIDVHSTRTGDYDSLLTFFTTASGLFFFTYCEKQKLHYLYLFFLFIGLAILTKSVVALFFVPAIVTYSIIQGQLIPLLKNKHFYIGLLSVLAIVIAYYLLREVKNEGYIAAVQQNELGGRFLNVNEDYKRNTWFYYNNLIDYRLPFWYLLIPCGLLMGFVIKNKRINRLTLFSFLMLITFFIVISASQTKLEWYDVPLYPFLAIVIAVFIYYIFNFLENSKWASQSLMINVLPFIFLFLIGINPYGMMIDKTYKPKENKIDEKFYEIGYYLKDALRGKYNIDGHFLLYDGYYAQNLFYLNILNDKGIAVSMKDWTQLESQDRVIASQKMVKLYVEEHYDHEIIFVKGNVITYKINERKGTK